MQGASGYKIYRTKYASNGTGGWTPEKVDVYYKDAGTSGEFRISEGEGTIGKKTTCTSTAGVYTLRDAYADSYDDTNPYSVNQSQIAWGLPYSYTVIPVLSEDDFSGDINLDTNKFELSNTCKVAYNGGDGIGAFADKVKGSAFGYGLNLNASKASDTNSVSITWTLPYGYADKVPYLYRRSYNGNSAWSKVPVGSFTVSDNNRIGLTVNKDDSDRCEPFDYLVSYDPQTVSSVHNSFIEEIERNENLDENGERACKGYAFTLPGITAKTGTGYSEEVYWEAYDYSKRAQGPESYEIFMRNDNKKDDWVKICTLKAGNNSQNATLNAETVDKGKYDIDLDFTGLSFTVKPSGIASGNTDGLLKVLRDAKHYYKIEAARKVGGTTDIRASYGDDKSVYAYRQITDEELVKSSLLVMAYAFYLNAGGKADLSNAGSKLEYDAGNNLSSVNGGSAVFGGRSLLGVSEAGKYKADVSMTNYAPAQLTPAGVSSVMLGISMANVSTRTKGWADCYLDKFRTENFTVSVAPVDSELQKLSSYTNEFTMTCTGSGNLTVKINGSAIVNATTSDVRRTWFPIQISDDHCWLKDSSYGWWED